MSAGIVTVNEDFEPSDRQDEILDLLCEGRVTPKLVTDRIDTRREYATRDLQDLVKAGWVHQVTRGLYELVEYPRNGG